MTNTRLVDAVRRFVKKVRDERITGTLGRKNADGTVTVAAPRVGWVYVTLPGGAVSQLPNTGSHAVPMRAGLPVRMMRLYTGELVLDGEDTSGLLEGDENAPGSVYAVNDIAPDVHGNVNLDTDDIPEGAANLYLTDERVRDAIGLALAAGANVTITVNDIGDTITIAAVGPGGISYQFSTTVTDADPGSGKLRFNNATFASITRIFIDDLDANGSDVQAWINALDDSTSTVRGYLTIFKASNAAIYRIFAISGALTDPGGYTKITVTPVVSNGALADNDPIVIMFARTGDKGDTGTAGTNGTNGATGAQGGYGGNSQEYKYSTTVTDADPGSGFIRFNNATFGSITQLFVDDNNNGGADVQAWVDSLDDSSSSVRGLIRVFLESNQAIFRLFNVTGANTDPGGYTKIAVAPLLSTGALANNDVVVVSFQRTGDKGDTGSAGATGAPGAAADTAANIAAAADLNPPIAGTKFAVVNASGTLLTVLWSSILTLLTSLFVLLAGKAGGQTINGGTAAGENLTLSSTAHATKGKILFGAAGLSAYDGVNNRLGVGANDPASDLEVATTATAATRGISSTQINSGAHAGLFNFLKARGTRASKTVVANGDFIGDFIFQPWDGAAYLRTAQIAAKVSGSVASGSVPTDILIATGDTDDASLANVRVTVKSTGEVGIGVAAPQGALHIHNGVGGSLPLVTKTGVAGTKVVIIPNATGDVTAAITGQYVLINSDGTKTGGVFTILNGGSYAVPILGGTVWTFTVNVNGEFSVIRTSGTDTATIIMSLVWG